MEIVNVAQQVEQGDHNNDDLYQQVEGSFGIIEDSYQQGEQSVDNNDDPYHEQSDTDLWTDGTTQCQEQMSDEGENEQRS